MRNKYDWVRLTLEELWWDWRYQYPNEVPNMTIIINLISEMNRKTK